MANLLSKREFLRRVRAMDPYLFEEFVADVWEERGYETTVRSGSGDRGIDFIATRPDEKQLIQVKRYSTSNKIGSQMVRNYATLYQQVEDASAVVVVTTSSFTDEARRLAQDLKVEAIGGDELYQIVDSHASNIAVDYFHQEETRSKFHQGEKNFEFDLVDRSPFSREYINTEIKQLQYRCIECGSANVWGTKFKKGNIFTVIKCSNCESVWANEASWPDHSLDHESWDRLAHEDDLERPDPDPCFIATAAYDTQKAEEIDVLRDFRDKILNQDPVGQVIVNFYYKTSPPIANWIRKTPQRRYAVREYFVAPLVRVVRKLLKSYE